MIGKEQKCLRAKKCIRAKKCTYVVFIMLSKNKARTSFVMAGLCFKKKCESNIGNTSLKKLRPEKVTRDN